MREKNVYEIIAFFMIFQLLMAYEFEFTPLFVCNANTLF